MTASIAAGLGRGVESPGPEVGAVVDDVVSAVGIRVDAIVACRSWMQGRWVLALASRRGGLGAIMKVGGHDDRGLRREGKMLDAVGRRDLGVEVPELLFWGERRGQHVVVTRPMGRRAAHVVDIEAAAAVATHLTAPIDDQVPIVHGDLSPWNLWRDGDRLVLIDWERAAPGRRPLWDLTRYVLVAGALAHSWPADRAVDLLVSPGGPGAEHLSAVGLDPGSTGSLLRATLGESSIATSDDTRRYASLMRAELAHR